MKALLTLEDGFSLYGKSFTGTFETGGEVIFTTAMTGYQEVLTDPSYCGQMVCMTWPLIGNYGVSAEDMDPIACTCAHCLSKSAANSPQTGGPNPLCPNFCNALTLRGWKVLIPAP